MRNARATSAAVLVTALLSAALASLIVVNPNILDLLPEDAPSTQAIKRLNTEENGANPLTIAIQDTTGDPEALDAFMVGLAEDIRQLEDIEYVLYDLDDEMAWRLGVLQLSADELNTIETKLRGALALGPGIHNPLIASRVLALGPLTDKLAQADARAMLAAPRPDVAQLIVRPTGSAYDPNFARPLMADIYQILDAAQAKQPGMEIPWVGGAYRHSYEEVEGIISDLSQTALLSFLLVFTVVSIGFRDVRAVFLIFTPIIIGNILTWGYAGVAVGVLNTFTSFFTAVLIGLGVDFAIHLYARFREEMGQTDDVEQAVIRAWDRTGPPSFTAAVTSAGGFLALWAANFQGFQQLGTLLAGGVLLCLLSVLVVLPLLIRWRNNRGAAIPLRAVSAPASAAAPPGYRLAPLGALAVLALTALAAMQLPKLAFEYDLSALRQAGTAWQQLDALKRDLAQDGYSPVVVSYDSDESLRADFRLIQRALENGELDMVKSALSIYTVLPEDQDDRVQKLQSIAALAQQDNVRYLPTQVQANLKQLSRYTPRVLAPADLPRGVQHILGVADGRHRMMLRPQGNMWDLRDNDQLAAELETHLPGRSIASEYVAQGMLYRLIDVDAARIGGLAMALIFFSTLIDLRSFGRAIGAVTAITVGMAWAGAGMVLFGIKLSLINFVGVPILMGIGIDIIIHLMHRIEEEGPGRVWFALSTTGWAAGLSTLTTIASFGALNIASNQGVQSLGKMIVLGLSVVTVAAFVVVPLGWMLVWRFRQPSSDPAAVAEREADVDDVASAAGRR